jgi:N-acyl-D-aspartate/D-glutamate deacylase
VSVRPSFDTVIAGGRVFDGRGSAPVQANVGIRGGQVAAVTPEPIHGDQVIDAAGRWVMPGFIDLHTHYDAEVELAPSLSESLRHGVTTVVLGSCSLSLAVGAPEDLADMFCRVEAIPYEVVRPLLEEKTSTSRRSSPAPTRRSLRGEVGRAPGFGRVLRAS